MSSLNTWAQRVIGVVEQDGNRAVQIRLTAEGQQWEIWDIVPGFTADEWTNAAETLMASLAEEFPVKRVSLIFTAEDKSGAVFSQFPRSITGKNKNAAELGTNTSVKAISDGWVSLAATVDKVLETARKQMDQQSARIDEQDNEIRQLHEIFRGVRQIELEAEEQQNQVGNAMLEQLKELGPMGKMFLEHWLDKEKNRPAAAAAGLTNGSNGKAATS
jgi:hypothetical protein